MQLYLSLFSFHWTVVTHHLHILFLHRYRQDNLYLQYQYLQHFVYQFVLIKTVEK